MFHANEESDAESDVPRIITSARLVVYSESDTQYFDGKSICSVSSEVQSHIQRGKKFIRIYFVKVAKSFVIKAGFPRIRSRN